MLVPPFSRVLRANKIAQLTILTFLTSEINSEASSLIELNSIRFPRYFQLFFDLYSALPSTLSHLALACLVQIASVRRSLFNNAERGKFLNQLVTGVREILGNPNGLTDPSNYHEFCR